MGSPFFPTLADLVSQDLETFALKDIGISLPFFTSDIWFIYDNDIITAVLSNKVEEVKEVFYSFHPRIQFTIEFGADSINFLDVTIINNNE